MTVPVSLLAMLQTTTLLCAMFPIVQLMTVSTKNGDLEGLIDSYPNPYTPFTSVIKFLGVPFAAPPIGKLRFKAPLPPNEWKPTVRQAKVLGKICWQDKTFEFLDKLFNENFIYSEDCLYLNVYTPNVSQSFPVMVYIHGGGYELGSALPWPGNILALQGLVVVIIQYRLGPFGFLTTGDSASPGNFGMLDQVEALKWVKENIENFGGNPNKVTIFGESAGATSVSLHLMSPLSQGLFHRVIAESGVDLCSWAIQPTSLGVNYAKELSQRLNCPVGNHDAMVNCIREKGAADIQNASKSTNSYRSVDYLQWAPVVDKNFLHDTPQNLRVKGDFERVPLMIGFTSNESADSLESMAEKFFGLTESVDNGVSPVYFKTFIAKLSQALNSRNKTADLIADALEFMYTSWPDNSDKYALRIQLVSLVSDKVFFAPSHQVGDIHSRVSSVYMYEFARRPKTIQAAEWMGVPHAANVIFDFGWPFLPNFAGVYDDADQNVSLFIMTTYANFARSGDPTPQSVSGITWEGYNSSHRAYLQVDAIPKMKSSFNPRRVSFWNDYYAKLTEINFDSKEIIASSESPTNVAVAAFNLIAVLTIFFK